MLDPARDEPTYSFPLSDGMGNRIHSYGSWEPTNSILWASKNYNESVSATSRTEAIARGQREMMEMVRNMPESSYELSLKDLVEKSRVNEESEEIEIEERKLIIDNQNEYRKVDQTAVKRSGNVYGGGFYLKMMFLPTSMGSTKNKKKKKKKKKNESLRASACEGSLNMKVGVDEEWWKKSPNVDSESGGSTSVNSGSTKSSGSSSSSSRSNSRRERRSGSCWFLIGKPKRLTQE